MAVMHARKWLESAEGGVFISPPQMLEYGKAILQRFQNKIKNHCIQWNRTLSSREPSKKLIIIKKENVKIKMFFSIIDTIIKFINNYVESYKNYKDNCKWPLQMS